MNKILRTIGLAAAVVGSVGLNSTTPASAGGAGVFTGVANINCFGCGSSTGTASLCVKGVVTDGPVVADCVESTDPSAPASNATASYTVAEPAGATCVVTGTASGAVTGVVNVTFNWTRVGAAAVISTTGDVDGSGVGGFVVTSPQGIPCGGPVTAEVLGAVAGT